MSEAILIRGADLEGAGRADLLLVDGLIADMGSGLSRAGATVVDADGMVALPGLVDLHVHLREPGLESAETVDSGSRAGSAGGFTALFAMPNTAPPADTAGAVEQQLALGERSGRLQVQPIGAVTVGRSGTRLAELGAMARSRARVRLFSDDGACVADPVVMRRALEYVKAFGGAIAQHAEDPRLTGGAQMNEGALSAELGLGGWPSVAEESIIARDVLLTEHVGSRLHVCHVSTAGSVEVLRWAKRRGVAVTAEVTPHHLMLTEQEVRGYDARYKVNPPLRRDEDVAALREALADGTIDAVATDHAPHPVESKHCEWDRAAPGMIGLDVALRVVQATMVDTGMLGWSGVARVMSRNPARIGRLAEQGRAIARGEPANLVLHDQAAGDAVITTADLHGLSGNSPYLGRELPGRTRWTFYRGRATMRDGDVVETEEVHP